MFRILIASALVSGALAGAASAGEWTRTTTGPNGRTATTHMDRDCVPGSCSFNSTTTGPNGGVYTRSGSANRTAPGEWSYQRNGTGQAGRQWKRSGTVRINR